MKNHYKTILSFRNSLNLKMIMIFQSFNKIIVHFWERICTLFDQAQTDQKLRDCKIPIWIVVSRQDNRYTYFNTSIANIFSRDCLLQDSSKRSFGQRFWSTIFVAIFPRFQNSIPEKIDSSRKKKIEEDNLVLGKKTYFLTSSLFTFCGLF